MEGGGGTRLASKVTPLFASSTHVPPARFFELWASILDDLTPKRRQLGPIFEFLGISAYVKLRSRLGGSFIFIHNGITEKATNC